MSNPSIRRIACLCCTLAMLWLSSCTAPRDIAYFQTIRRDTTLQNVVAKNFDLKIKPGDHLSITIASASSELSAQFNTSPGGGGVGAGGGYLVDKNGAVQLYKLGNVNVAGLTRAAVREKLEQDLVPYLKDPVVTVRLLNQQVTVLGEVGSPGVLTLTGDHLTILDAIGQSGDLTKAGRRNNIMVIRQTENGREFRHLNLLDHSVFSSPYFYLQNEDVVYVEPDLKKEASKAQQTISYVISGVSILSLILSRIR